jgi:poly(3-hydroxybutyrate) depolymerase
MRIGIVKQPRHVLFGAIPVMVFLLLGCWLSACSNSPFKLEYNPTPYYRDEPTEYYLYLPSSYTAEKEWPVFVGIHGFGSNGTACLDMWQAYADREGFVLVCPCMGDENGGWYQDEGERMLRAVLKEVKKECRVQDKIFLAGFSAGAQFVQGFAFAYPKSVSGVAVLSSGNYYEPSSGARSVPFLVVIGDQDFPAGLKSAGQFNELLKQAGYVIDLHILPGVKHEISNQAMELTIEFYRKIYQP